MNLTENQKKNFRTTLEHVDKLLSECEQILSADASSGLFRQYVPDLNPLEKEKITNGIVRLRESMKRALESQSIGMETPFPIRARHALITAFQFMDIALQELTSRYMRGYGGLSDEDSRELDLIVSRMRDKVQDIRSLLALKS